MVNLFARITPISAYWLGFLFADGHLHRKYHRLQCELQKRDRGHLEMLERDLGYKNTIKNKTKTLNGKSFKSSVLYIGPRSTARTTPKLNAKMISESLRKLQWHEFKDGDIGVIASFNNKIFACWLAGFLDGDGSIMNIKHSPRKYLYVGWFSKHRKILKFISRHLNDIIGTNKNTPQKSGTIFKISWTGMQAVKILDWLYEHTPRRLDRKYARYMQYRRKEKLMHTKNQKRYVSDDQIKRIASLSNSGYNDKQISEMTSISQLSVRKHRIKLGMPANKKRVVRQHTKDKMLKLKASGMSIRKISTIMDISYSTTQRTLSA